ncbi:YbeD family protein [Aquisalimonas asiatica]|uniref:UPF0250 protein SAMN04488052_11171 n=1 Tax=Aquisalimonas asiatica TaxID=406100 RepID=A0A1H8VD40_9GAMM|nr:DUF493 domain-containing protein [Aquisalimonas asiatica]SEP13193.1 hypothetical protein SAMN04488052_11171 [Aquisalimonas asiatica]
MHTQDDDTLLEFPCEFPIKAMGPADPEFVLHVLELVRAHVPDVDDNQVTTASSSRGTYVSVTVTVTATSKSQLDAVYQSLNADEQVVMTL